MSAVTRVDQARALSVVVRRNPPRLRLTPGQRLYAIHLARRARTTKGAHP